MEGSWPDGPTVVKVTEMALDHIHAQTSMLPGHKLRFSWVNTQVSSNNKEGAKNSGGKKAEYCPGEAQVTLVRSDTYSG